ncbi:MAG: PQQ-dependent sugar dehydrogenase [Pseudomonadota bacterium]
MKYLLVLAFLFAQFTFADFNTTLITDRLERPWGLAFLPDGRYLVTERVGRLRIVDNKGKISAAVTGLPDISVVGQGGLLDVVLHPDFSSNQWIYLSYAAGSDGKYNTEVVRAQLVNNALINTQKIFTALPKVSGGRHFGSRLVFDNAGYLYISLGDRGQRQQSQNLQSHHGSVIRLHDDGRIPEDNPFANQPDSLPEIYSYGHRNIQGMALHPKTGEVWAHEHGPQGGDEINIVVKGSNYGWPVITYGAEYGSGFKIGEGTQKAGMKQPVYFWDPSIAPSGMAFYKDDLLVGALKFQLLSRLKIKGEAVIKEDRLFARQFGRVRDVKISPSGNIYLLTDANRGRLVKLTAQ